ncbi:hypothetical protein SDC9_140812 [bioreactor metagenome]|uniref:Uncharacterized protein n=1 Tax=bioreactor metagenome TaxID=1076179 RepID=A0A645DZB7_9ZZZZ
MRTIFCIVLLMLVSLLYYHYLYRVIIKDARHNLDWKVIRNKMIKQSADNMKFNDKFSWLFFSRYVFCIFLAFLSLGGILQHICGYLQTPTSFWFNFFEALLSVIMVVFADMISLLLIKLIFHTKK